MISFLRLLKESLLEANYIQFTKYYVEGTHPNNINRIYRNTEEYKKNYTEYKNAKGDDNKKIAEIKLKQYFAKAFTIIVLNRLGLSEYKSDIVMSYLDDPKKPVKLKIDGANAEIFIEKTEVRSPVFQVMAGNDTTFIEDPTKKSKYLIDPNLKNENQHKYVFDYDYNKNKIKKEDIVNNDVEAREIRRNTVDKIKKDRAEKNKEKDRRAKEGYPKYLSLVKIDKEKKERRKLWIPKIVKEGSESSFEVQIFNKLKKYYEDQKVNIKSIKPDVKAKDYAKRVMTYLKTNEVISEGYYNGTSYNISNSGEDYTIIASNPKFPYTVDMLIKVNNGGYISYGDNEDTYSILVDGQEITKNR